MPTYLVRWPGLTASLISAEDEDHLQLVLDEVGDPGGCTWKEYDGPIWVNFQLPVSGEVKERKDGRPTTIEDIQINDVSRIVETEDCLMDLSVGEAETGFEMKRALTEFAFPAVAECFDDALDEHDGPPEEEQVKAAVKDDLRVLLQHEWRQRQLKAKSGAVPELMRQMGITVIPPGLAAIMERQEEAHEDMGIDFSMAFPEDPPGYEREFLDNAMPVNSGVAVVKPKGPFVRWVNKVRTPEQPYTKADLRGDCTALLTAPHGLQADDSFIESHFMWIFENELLVWAKDQETWPKGRDYKRFQKWFDVELHTNVLSFIPDDIF